MDCNWNEVWDKSLAWILSSSLSRPLVAAFHLLHLFNGDNNTWSSMNGQVLCNGATHWALCQHHFSPILTRHIDRHKTMPETILESLSMSSSDQFQYHVFKWPRDDHHSSILRIIRMGLNANLFVLLTAKVDPFVQPSILFARWCNFQWVNDGGSDK